MPIVRYGLPLALLLVGVAFLVIEPNTTGLEGFCAGAGAAMALLLLNLLFRAGVAGDRDRDREEEARAFFDEHGRWPDEPAPEPPPAAPQRETPGHRLPRGADGGAIVTPRSGGAAEQRRAGARLKRPSPTRRR
jgi:hypothetical protein